MHFTGWNVEIDYTLATLPLHLLESRRHELNSGQILNSSLKYTFFFQIITTLFSNVTDLN